MRRKKVPAGAHPSVIKQGSKLLHISNHLDPFKESSAGLSFPEDEEWDDQDPLNDQSLMLGSDGIAW